MDGKYSMKSLYAKKTMNQRIDFFLINEFYGLFTNKIWKLKILQNWVDWAVDKNSVSLKINVLDMATFGKQLFNSKICTII